MNGGTMGKAQTLKEGSDAGSNYGFAGQAGSDSGIVGRVGLDSGIMWQNCELAAVAKLKLKLEINLKIFI
ncbi:hypothetical protein M5K25_003103 [Dendrobium thyrsiflorum]|uniref:Uncharacterized protein n=1 Tax=Dendrobium thyrsiflorum TaxID=117978 RepID=A0ABD0VP59_DENTH